MPRLTQLRKFVRERIGAFRVQFVIRLVQWPLRAATRPLLRRVPRSPKLIAFGVNSDRFADNPAYLFLHMADSSGLRCVWVSGSQDVVDSVRAAGYEAVRRWSFQGIVVALRASWYVFASNRSDVNRWLSDGAIALNLWHGVGVKPIKRGRTFGEGSRATAALDGSLTARVFADERRSPDWLLTTSPMMTSIFAHAFDVPEDRCIEFGYPRNDHLIAGCQPPPLLVDQTLYDAVRRKRPVVGYFPTFREWSASLPGGAPLIAEISEIVAEQGGTFVFKAHQYVLQSTGDSAAPRSDASGSDMVVLPKNADLNAYLGECDVLVTDYSSVSSDYLFLERPVVLFVPDFDEYEDVRGFLFDPKEMMPGVVTRTKAELYDVLAHVGQLSVSDNNQRLLDSFWSPGARGGASERIAQFIKDHAI